MEDESWNELEKELDAWREVGRKATFWWRDDDASATTPELTRLLDLRARVSVPLVLSVVPDWAKEDLAETLDANDDVAVLQHGIAHANNAPEGHKSCEFPIGEPHATVLVALSEARHRLATMFPIQYLPAFVPPWNRIDPSLLPSFPRVGIFGLSGFNRRGSGEPAPGLHQTNCHVDLVNWRGDRGFVGASTCIEQFVKELAWRRAAPDENDEPIGILTHHLDHDEAGWSFLEAFLERTRAHSAVRWLSGAEALWPTG